jgi:transposase
MPKKRRFSSEFKREAVELIRQPGISCRQVALEIGINPNVLTRWRREAETNAGKAFIGSGTPRDPALSQ